MFSSRVRVNSGSGAHCDLLARSHFGSGKQFRGVVVSRVHTLAGLKVGGGALVFGFLSQLLSLHTLGVGLLISRQFSRFKLLLRLHLLLLDLQFSLINLHTLL